jgi:hypothetical protein
MVKIQVFISASNAVMGSCAYGWTNLELDTASWTEDERRLLALKVVEWGNDVRYGYIATDRMGLNRVIAYPLMAPTEQSLRASMRTPECTPTAHANGRTFEIVAVHRCDKVIELLTRVEDAIDHAQLLADEYREDYLVLPRLDGVRYQAIIVTPRPIL